MDSQAAGEDRCRKSDSTTAASDSDSAKIRARSRITTQRKTAARSEQSEDERLPEGDCGYLPDQQKSDSPLRKVLTMIISNEYKNL